MARKMLFPRGTVSMPSKSLDRFPAYAETEGLTGVESADRDRRRRIRMQVHWPLVFSRPGNPVVETVTNNLSSDGFYCLANTTFVPGEVTECTLGVPTHNPRNGGRVLAVQCKVRVIRVEVLQENGMYGVGCRIEDYRFTSEHASYRILGALSHEVTKNPKSDA
jgi:hypothetical protein